MSFGTVDWQEIAYLECLSEVLDPSVGIRHVPDTLETREGEIEKAAAACDSVNAEGVFNSIDIDPPFIVHAIGDWK